MKSTKFASENNKTIFNHHCAFWPGPALYSPEPTSSSARGPAAHALGPYATAARGPQAAAAHGPPLRARLPPRAQAATWAWAGKAQSRLGR